MNQAFQLGQIAQYGCNGAVDSSYGAGGYSTCDTTTAPGAPNTGFFGGIVESGSLSIILPLVLAVVIVVVATFTMRRKNKNPVSK